MKPRKKYTAYFNRFSVVMTGEQADDMSRPGQPADSAVEYWKGKIKVDASPDDIRAELEEYGAWNDDELADDDANIDRILWSAACNIRDEEYENSRA